MADEAGLLQIQGDRSQGASAALRLSTAKLLGQFDHLASVVSLIDFAKALAPFDLSSRWRACGHGQLSA